MWIQHSSSGMPHLPKTDDEVDYGRTTWKVIGGPDVQQQSFDRLQAAGDGMTRFARSGQRLDSWQGQRCL